MSNETNSVPYTTVFDVMRPLERLKFVTPETPVSEALEIIGFRKKASHVWLSFK
jgi:hypothetical protein